MDLPPFRCFAFCPIKKNISKRRNYQIIEVDPDTDTNTAE
jgi:hypothetical protein